MQSLDDSYAVLTRTESLPLRQALRTFPGRTLRSPTQGKASPAVTNRAPGNIGDVTSEIERYLVNPGQALAYKVGMNRILELREKAKAELGDKFVLARFHDMMLTGGDMPLTLLDRRVAEWIAVEKGA